MVKLDQAPPLTSAEEAILRSLLSPDFPGAKELRAQIPEVRVIARCDCGCPTIDLDVPSSVVKASVSTTSNRTPYEGDVRGPDAESIVDIIVFIDDGRLSSLEYVTHQEPAARTWPNVVDVATVGPLA
jgi:hypothetical protein